MTGQYIAKSIWQVTGPETRRTALLFMAEHCDAGSWLDGSAGMTVSISHQTMLLYKERSGLPIIRVTVPLVAVAAAYLSFRADGIVAKERPAC